MKATDSITTQDQQSNDLSLTGIAVTYSNRITQPQGEIRTLEDIVTDIRSNEGLRNSISTLRSISDQQARQDFKKKNLPWFSCSEFKENRRTNESFLTTEFLVIDLDHVGERLQEIVTSLRSDPKVFISFLSPSGDGIKVVFALASAITASDDYRRLHRQLQKYISKKYGVTPDTDDDPARATFLSSDPDIHVNPNCERISVGVQEGAAQSSLELTPAPSGSDLLLAFQGSSSPGRTANTTKIVGYLIEKEVREEISVEMLKIWNTTKNTPPLDEAKIVGTVRDMYRRYGESRMRDNLAPFYSHGTDILDVGIIGEEFFLEPIGAQKFYLRAGAADKDQQEKFMAHIVKEKHIRHLRRVDHLGDASAATSGVKHIDDQGVIEVRYAPIGVRVQDNDFIEKWLSSTFGPHGEFIKQWLAVYVYTNYQKLPTLVLKGDRGTGKNTFADAVMAIYPSISQYWHGEERSFTPEVQKKLLIADESVSANEKQYRMLKQRSGQKMAVVNQKYLPEYQVRNNMNIIVLSNEATPIFVQKDEEPTSEKNNQFFVFSLPRFEGEIDPDFGKKIEGRLGHYIRTELRKVYEEIKDLKGYRYSIPTPITDQEKALFNVNQTGLEDEAMRVLRRMVKEKDVKVEQFFANGFFPVSFLNDLTVPHGYSKNGIIRNLKEKGYLQASDPVRKMVLKEREYCYEMTPKLKMWYRKEKAAK